MNLRDLATRLEACAADAVGFKQERLQALADAARELDRLRDYRRMMDAYLFHMPLGDINDEAEAVRDNVREFLNAAADSRQWAYREIA